MASITVPYTAVTGSPFTAADFNGLWTGAIITLTNGEVTNAKLGALSVTKDKLNSNCAGTGLVQAGDGSLSVIAVGGGIKGYRTTALTNADVTLVNGTDVREQDFTGTLTGNVNLIAATASGTPAAGDEFRISLTGVVMGANSLVIKSNVTALVTFSEPGTLSGFVDLVYTGSAWAVRRQVTNLI